MRASIAQGTAKNESTTNVKEKNDKLELNSNEVSQKNTSSSNEECENNDNDTEIDVFSQIKKYRLKDINKVILATLNINTIG